MNDDAKTTDTTDRYDALAEYAIDVGADGREAFEAAHQQLVATRNAVTEAINATVPEGANWGHFVVISTHEAAVVACEADARDLVRAAGIVVTTLAKITREDPHDTEVSVSDVARAMMMVATALRAQFATEATTDSVH